MEMLTPDCKYPFLVFDNVVSEESIPSIFEEINYLSKFSSNPNESGTATDSKKNPLKSNRCVFLQEFYNLEYADKNSPILLALEKLLIDDFENAVRNYHPVFSHYIADRLIKKSGFLLSMYYDGDYYLPHDDGALYTAVLWLDHEPKTYEGGEFFFHFEDGSIEEVEYKNNRMVLFPSYYKHEVKEVKYLNDDAFPRCSISALLG